MRSFRQAAPASPGGQPGCETGAGAAAADSPAKVHPHVPLTTPCQSLAELLTCMQAAGAPEQGERLSALALPAGGDDCPGLSWAQRHDRGVGRLAGGQGIAIGGTWRQHTTRGHTHQAVWQEPAAKQPGVKCICVRVDCFAPRPYQCLSKCLHLYRGDYVHGGYVLPGR